MSKMTTDIEDAVMPPEDVNRTPRDRLLTEEEERNCGSI